MIKNYKALFFFLPMISFGQLHAANTADVDAQLVSLEENCGTNQNNCFDNIPSLYSWIHTTRSPDVSAPLTVNVGNGTFSIGYFYTNTLTCDDQEFTGYISFIGNGVNNSIFQLGSQSDFAGFFTVSGCEGMTFSNIKFRTDARYGYIEWRNGGSSTWNNVEVNGKGAAWVDTSCAAEEGEHYWYSSKLSSQTAFTSASTYQAHCDKTWLFGSEVTSIIQADSILNANQHNAIRAESNSNSDEIEPEIHLYGSNIRAISHSAFSPNPTRGTVHAGRNSKVHIHGSGIDSISTVGADIFILTAKDGGFIHANESSYVVNTTGIATRITNNASTIKAPYLWEQGDNAPPIISVDGADTFIDTSGDFPMMYIYKNDCVSSGGPWVSITGQCRL